MMKIVVIGLNHKTAPLEARERVSFSRDSLEMSYGRLSSHPDISECLILSTCNRVELYGIGRDADAVEAALNDMLYKAHGIRPGELDAYLYIREGLDAVSHLFMVATGLDSMVIGESHIAQQMRNAYNAAALCGAAGPVIKTLVSDSLRSGAKARALTGISRGVTSIPGVAVNLIREEPDIDKKRIIVVGAGKIGKMTIVKLADIPAKEIVVMNRDKSRAQDIGERHNVVVKDFGSLEAELCNADVVVAATASDHYLIDRAMMEKAVSVPGREMLCIDLGVPRNIDEPVGEVRGVRLYNIDDLRPIVEETIRNRTCEAGKARMMVRDEAGTKYASYGLTGALPVACGR